MTQPRPVDLVRATLGVNADPCPCHHGGLVARTEQEVSMLADARTGRGRAAAVILVAVMLGGGASGLAACGSRGPIENDPYGRDAGRIVPLGGDAALDAAPPCGWENISEGLSGAGIAVLERDPRAGASDVLFGATATRIYRSADGGSTWEVRGATPAPVYAITFPDETTDLLVGTGDGVWVSHDEGLTFEPRGLRGLVVAELEAHPAARDRVFASVLALGVLRSNDGGASFNPVSAGLEPRANVVRIDGDPRDPDALVALSILADPVLGSWTAEGQALRTADGGATWTEVDRTGGRGYELRRCEADPAVIVAARGHGLFRSRDGGQSFEQLTALSGPTPTAVDVGGASCERIVAFLPAPAEVFGLQVSTDGGASFQGPFLEGFAVTRFARAPPILHLLTGARVVAGAVTGVFVSDDDGRSYRTVAGLTELGVGVLATSGGHLWAGTGGAGLWVLDRDSSRWARIPTTLLENDFTFSLLPMGEASLGSGDILVGSYGSLYARRAPSPRFELVPNDGNETDNVMDFEVLDDGTILTASQTEGVQRSEDGGASFRTSNAGFEPWLTLLGPLVDVRALGAGPAGSGVVIAGTNGAGLWRSVDGGRTWARTEVTNGDVGWVAFEPSRGLYMATLLGAGVLTSSDGVGWAFANEGLDSLDAEGIAIDEGRVWVAAGGRVYEAASGPAGLTWAPFADDCSPARARRPTIVTRPDGHWLFVGSGAHGVFRHDLD